MVVLLVAGLTGCVMHWEPQPGPVPVAVANAGSTELRITRRDGTHIVLMQVSVEGDSLVGKAEPDTPSSPSARVGIPLADISTVSRREVDQGASVAVGTVAGLLVIYATLVMTGPVWSD